MEQNKITLGRVIEYNNKTGVGEIISLQNTYMFLKDDLRCDEINKGDLVKFRAEKVHDINKAFFIDRFDLSNEKEYDKEKIKKYYAEFIKRDE